MSTPPPACGAPSCSRGRVREESKRACLKVDRERLQAEDGDVPLLPGVFQGAVILRIDRNLLEITGNELVERCGEAAVVILKTLEREHDPGGRGEQVPRAAVSARPEDQRTEEAVERPSQHVRGRPPEVAGLRRRNVPVQEDP